MGSMTKWPKPDPSIKAHADEFDIGEWETLKSDD